MGLFAGGGEAGFDIGQRGKSVLCPPAEPTLSALTKTVGYQNALVRQQSGDGTVTARKRKRDGRAPGRAAVPTDRFIGVQAAQGVFPQKNRPVRRPAFP